MKSPQPVKVIQMRAVRIPVMKKRENGRENQKRNIKRRKRNINTNIGNHQNTLIVTVIQEKSIQRRGRVSDKILLFIKMRMERYRQRSGAQRRAQLYCYTLMMYDSTAVASIQNPKMTGKEKTKAKSNKQVR